MWRWCSALGKLSLTYNRIRRAHTPPWSNQDGHLSVAGSGRPAGRTTWMGQHTMCGARHDGTGDGVFHLGTAPAVEMQGKQWVHSRCTVTTVFLLSCESPGSQFLIESDGACWHGPPRHPSRVLQT